MACSKELPGQHVGFALHESQQFWPHYQAKNHLPSRESKMYGGRICPLDLEEHEKQGPMSIRMNDGFSKRMRSGGSRSRSKSKSNLCSDARNVDQFGEGSDGRLVKRKMQQKETWGSKRDQ